MNRSIFFIVLLSIGFFSQVSAVMQPQVTYESFELFQASGDAPICKVVTDGCNEWSYADGQRGDPIKACKLTADFDYTWSCAQYNDDIMFLQGGVEDTVEGDMMYVDPLTMGERQNYTVLQEKISETQMLQIQKVVSRYMEKRAAYSLKQQEIYFKKVQALIQKYIDIRTQKDDIYLMFQFLKLEIKVMSQNFPIGGFAPLSGDLYTCKDREYRVYDTDYLIDDMMFAVEKDTIHVSDGTYLLPNFVADQEVSASGIKYVGTNTETQEAYTFWMKGDEMSVYKAETLIDTCMKK